MRIGVGEHLADIGKAGRSGDGVNEGVEDDIRIGVAVEAFVVRDHHIGEHERATGDGAVQVVAETDA